MITPLDFRDRLLSHQGAAFALEPKLLQSAWFRPHNLSEEVENLYLVGAGTHPGAGMPGVLTSAKLVSDLIPAAAAVAAGLSTVPERSACRLPRHHALEPDDHRETPVISGIDQKAGLSASSGISRTAPNAKNAV